MCNVVFSGGESHKICFGIISTKRPWQYVMFLNISSTLLGSSLLNQVMIDFYVVHINLNYKSYKEMVRDTGFEPVFSTTNYVSTVYKTASVVSELN